MFGLSIAQKPMQIQKPKLNYVFDNWRGDLEQVYDVSVIGVHI